MSKVPVTMIDALGLSPARLAAQQARLAIFGDGHNTPRSRFDHTSLHIFTPRVAVSAWFGHLRPDRLVPIMNFVNRTPTPVEEGWSVRVRQVRDWRGGRLTYDSHNGTDFVCPPGLPVVAAAPGRVMSVRREFNRGGLKLYLDHGGTLVTTSNHLTTTLVEVGEEVRRGQIVALSGYSGLDGVIGFPWVAPHVHYNVWFGGVAVDPYAENDHEVSLWRRRNDPVPMRPGEVIEDPPWRSSFAPIGVQRAFAALRDAGARRRIGSLGDPDRQAAELLIESITYPTRFDVPEAGRLLYDDGAPRTPRLDLPFSADDVRGTVILER